MPQFNESSALLFKRSVEAGITSPTELANILGNASVETKGFTTMHEDLGYKTYGAIVAASTSAATRNTTVEINSALQSGDPQQIAHILYDGRSDLGNTQPGDGW